MVTVTIHYARPVYQTEVTLFLAYLLMFMPRALINLRAGIAQAPVELENVARSLGRSPARALWSITMRLAAPGAAAGAALVFLGVSNELTATLLLSPLGTRTLSTGFWALTSEIRLRSGGTVRAIDDCHFAAADRGSLYAVEKNGRVVTCWNCLLFRNPSLMRWSSIISI